MIPSQRVKVQSNKRPDENYRVGLVLCLAVTSVLSPIVRKRKFFFTASIVLTRHTWIPPLAATGPRVPKDNLWVPALKA